MIEKDILINAGPAIVWEALTNPDRMKQWMGEPEMNIEVITDWKAGGSIVIKGFHHVNFINKGTVLRFETGKSLMYDYLSSISRLPDTPENHTVIGFTLTPVHHGTSLKIELNNFPTETIRKHNEFYWKTTIELLKQSVEDQLSDGSRMQP